MSTRPTEYDRYIFGLRRDMRAALAEFRKQDEKWNELNDAFLAKIKEENRIRRSTGRAPHSALSVTEQKTNWLELGDAMNAATWFRAKADMLAGVLAAELALSQSRGQ